MRTKTPTLLPLALFVALSAHGATYFVDARAGLDSNAGTSANAAWKTLARVNSVTLRAGDRVLFRAGSAWSGEQLAPRGAGTATAPIVFDKYGDGARPRIDGAGQVEDAVRLYNIPGVELRALEITNHGATAKLRRGVHVVADNIGVVRHVVLAGLYIHDVNGVNDNKDNGGIAIRVDARRVATWYDGLTIERNIVWRVDRSAISFPHTNWQRTHYNPSLHVIIRDNLVDDIGGDGIVPILTRGALVEHNIARHCNRRAGSDNAGMWPWSTDDTLFQYNEAAFTHTTRDGEGFDSDYNSRNTVFQYNYSHDNEGGFMLICAPGKRNQAENIGNQGTLIRRNVSRNDRTGVFQISAAENTRIEDNVAYIGAGLDVQAVLFTDWDGWAANTAFRNNTFYAEGTARYGHATSRREDRSYTMAPGWGPATQVVFELNRYYGHHVDAPADAQVQPLDKAALPKVDWNIPVFDASSGDGFDAFLIKHRAALLRMLHAHFAEVRVN